MISHNLSSHINVFMWLAVLTHNSSYWNKWILYILQSLKEQTIIPKVVLKRFSFQIKMSRRIISPYISIKHGLTYEERERLKPSKTFKLFLKFQKCINIELWWQQRNEEMDLAIQNMKKNCENNKTVNWNFVLWFLRLLWGCVKLMFSRCWLPGGMICRGL